MKTSADPDYYCNPGSMIGVMNLALGCGSKIEIHGKNCTMIDLEFFLTGFGAIEISEGVWASEFGEAY